LYHKKEKNNIWALIKAEKELESGKKWEG